VDVAQASTFYFFTKLTKQPAASQLVARDPCHERLLGSDLVAAFDPRLPLEAIRKDEATR